MISHIVELFEATSLWRAEKRRQQYEEEIRRDAEEHVRYCERREAVEHEVFKIQKAKREAQK
jgi:hypothetical protein